MTSLGLDGVRLELGPLRNERESAELACYMPPPGTTARAILARLDGARVLVHTSASAPGSPLRWLMRQYLLSRTNEVVRQLDLTVFDCDEERFVERERYQASDGPNLHAQPIALPRVIERGVWHCPFSDQRARVCLGFAGTVALRRGEVVEEARAICLTAEQGAERRSQWMVEGVGEVAVGGEHGDFQRWLLGFSSDSGRQLFAGAGAWPALESLPTLPRAAGPTRATKSLF